ncbi:MAG: PAS domain S-box protein, partial [Thermodesulfobacteriota bacterium]
MSVDPYKSKGYHFLGVYLPLTVIAAILVVLLFVALKMPDRMIYTCLPPVFILLILLVGLVIHGYFRRKYYRDNLALSESRNSLIRIFDSIGDGVMVTDDQGLITRMNPAAEQLTGWSQAEASGRKLLEVFRIFNTLTRREAEDPVHEVLKNGFTAELAGNITLVAKDDTEYQVADTGAPTRNDRGEITGVVLVFRDVTEKYERERTLKENEERFRSLFINMGSGAMIVETRNEGQDFVFLDFNSAAEKIEGLAREKVLGHSVLEIFPGIKETGIFKVMKRVWQTGEPEHMPPVFYEDEQISGWRENYIYRLGNGEVVAMYEDVSERKALEEELRESKDFLEKVLESLSHPFYVVDPLDYTIKLANRAARFGDYQEGATCYQVCYNRSEPCTGEDHPCPLREVIETGQPTVGEHVHYNEEGERYYVETHAYPVFDREGSISRVIIYALDITERKEAETECQRLVTTIKQVADSIVITDHEGTILYVNPSFERITGYSRLEAIGENFIMLKNGVQDEPFYEKMWETLHRGETWRGHLTNRKKNGELYEEEATITPVLDENGEIKNFVAVKRDITEKLELERQLRQTQKMEAIGTLAGGIAHDFNNILAAILGFSELAKDELAADDKARKDLDKVLEAGNRAKELVKQILTFSRSTEKDLKPLKVQYILKEALKMLRSTIPSSIEIKENIDTGCESVLADPTQIYQVIMNLCTNAYQAMHGRGGILGVTLSQSELDENNLSSKWDLEPGVYIILEVSDTGPGIPEHLMERIFEPYFTTKKKEEGTGMGLSVVHGIVKGHGGHVSVYSELGQGATFRVYLPRYGYEAPASEQKKSEGSLPGGKERILVVDDEEFVVRVEKRMLENLGYEVTALTSSKEALEIFRKDPEYFDLVITDMAMPELAGAQLSKNLLEVRSDIPIILCTGYSDLINQEKAKKLGIREYLMK